MIILVALFYAVLWFAFIYLMYVIDYNVIPLIAHGIRRLGIEGMSMPEYKLKLDKTQVIGILTSSALMFAFIAGIGVFAG